MQNFETRLLTTKFWKYKFFVFSEENFVDAAIREVWEETGVRCEFQTVVCLRHSHEGGFNCSDLYIVIGLKALSNELRSCDREIDKIKWLPADEYLEDPNVHGINRHFVRTYLDYTKRNIQFTCLNAIHPILKKEYSLYYLQSTNGNQKADDDVADEERQLPKLGDASQQPNKL